MIDDFPWMTIPWIADVPPAVSDDRCLYSQATFSVKNQDILNDDALHFKLPRSVLKIASFEFANHTNVSLLTPLS